MRTASISTFVIALFCLSKSMAQDSNFSFKIETGPAIIFLQGSPDYYDYHPKLGMVAGVGFTYDATDVFSLRSTWGYERKGTGMWAELYRDIGGSGMYFSENRLDYLTTSFLGRIKIGKSRQPYILSGIYSGYLLDYGLTVVDKDRNFVREIIAPEDYYTQFDFGIVAGIGYSIKLFGNSTLEIEICNNLGIVKITDSKEYKTNSTTFTLGYSHSL